MGRKLRAGTHLGEEETKAGETRSRQEAVGKIPEGSRVGAGCEEGREGRKWERGDTR